ncbi:MAG: hypothetical protein VYE68_01755 [Acidobacteriota bacterium]|nr:hypothetical protein [Acidobacteriota bacterium]
MLRGTVGLVMAALCLGGFFWYSRLGQDGGSLTATYFWLGLGCGVFCFDALRSFQSSRSEDRRSAEDALRRARRYQDAQ